MLKNNSMNLHRFPVFTSDLNPSVALPILLVKIQQADISRLAEHAIIEPIDAAKKKRADRSIKKKEEPKLEPIEVKPIIKKPQKRIVRVERS